MKTDDILEQLIARYPVLASCRNEILSTFNAWTSCFQSGRKLMICGNGGSSADSQHIVGELMKEFNQKRALEESFVRKLENTFPDDGLASRLQAPLPAIALGMNAVLTSAYSNDVAPEMIFAQEVYGYGKKGDILLGISTSGNSKNVVNALKVAKSMNIKCVGMCGENGGALKELCDICIVIPEKEVYLIQELMLPVYHALCRMVEAHYWRAE